jgi:hypothetical protein
VWNHVGFFVGARGDTGNRSRKELVMLQHLTPMLASYIWVGGGGLGLILVIIIIVLLVRR